MVAAGEKPLMRPDALSAPYEAMQSLGRGLADAGSVLGTYAVKKMEAESTVQVGRAEEKMRDTRSKFEDWKLKNPDSTKSSL